MKNSKNITKKILFAMIIGIFVGTVLNQFATHPFVSKYLSDIVFALGSKGFVKLIKMVVVPLVFFSLIVGTSEMGDIAKLGRVGTKTMLFYIISTGVALTIAISLALITKPGVGFNMTGYTDAMANFTAKESPGIVNMVLKIIPSNPIAALASGDMLQIIFFAVLIGTAITILGDKASKVKEFCIQANDIMIQMIWMVMAIAPYGVFFLAAGTFTKLGFAAFKPLAVYMLTVFSALFIHAIIIYGSLLVGVAKVNPIQFIKNFFPAMTLAFSTASSNATLPVTMECVNKRCGVDKEIASFTVPLGATVNMDGSAMMQGVATVFIAQAYGLPLPLTTIVTVIVTATLSSIGTAGVPGGSLIMLSMVLTSVGLPVEAIGIIMGIDRILSMTRTMINVTGDAACTLAIARTEGLIDDKVFNDNSIGLESNVTA